MKKLSLVLIFIMFNSFVFNAAAQAFKTNNGHVEFLSKAPLNEFIGTSEKLKGLIDLDKNLLDFYLDLNTLDTGIKLRDKHMRDNYLETKKYPFAEFSGRIKEDINPNNKDSQRVTAIGKFKIHGIERVVEVLGELVFSSNQSVHLKASFSIKLSDYKIPIPSVLFYELSEEQIITINTKLISGI